MPRKARIDAPGALHHIIIRGIERKAIFKDTTDRENFFERCGQIIFETETGCYAWVYMRNHRGLLRSIGGWAELKEFRDLGIRIKGDERLLGSSDFVERVLKQADEQLEEKYRLRVSAISLQGLMDQVARYFKIEAANLKSSSKERRVTEARRILCYIAVRKLGYKCTDVSKAMGISAVTASKAANLGSKLSQAGKIQKLILED